MPEVRLLLDENLSFRLVSRLRREFATVVHIDDVGLRGASDDAVWAYARAEGFFIVSKDADFHQRSFLWGAPPKVVWLRIGNATTEQIGDLFVDAAETVREFAANDDKALLELS